MKGKITSLAIILCLVLQGRSQSAFKSYPLPTGSPIDQRLKADLKTDAAGNTWIAFTGRKLGNNLFVSAIGLAKFNGTAWTTWNTSNSALPSNYLTSIDFDGANVWVGTKNGLAKLAGSAWTIYQSGTSGLVHDSINDIKVKNGVVWVATHHGISKLDGTNWTSYHKGNSAIVSDMVTTIEVDNAGAVWCGTPDGISKLSGSTFTNYTKSNSALKSNPIYAIHTDAAGNVWIGGEALVTSNGTHSGIYKVVTGVITPVQDTVHYCNQSSLPSSVYSITSDSAGHVFIQGREKLYTFTSNNYASTITDVGSMKEKTYNISQYKTLSTSVVLMLSTDRNGSVWFTQADYNDSMYRFTPSLHISQKSDTVWFGEKIAYLNVNKVSTPILTRGDMGWDLSEGKYEVPAGSCKKALFASALWIGGVTNGQLRVAAQTYRQSGNDFYPGPLAIGTAAIDRATSEAWNKIWKLSRWNIDDFKANYSKPGYVMHPDILSWPAHGDTTKGQAWNLAPFVNVGGAANKYEPLVGDYPLIKGDQMLFWIFNDTLNMHAETEGRPLGVEVHASAYAFKCDDVAEHDSNTAINYTTFYHYDIFNRTGQLIDSLKVGMWVDADLGNWSDDRVGCNPKEGYGYVYNGDSIDDGWSGYGTNPPAIAIVQLKGVDVPTGNNPGMSNFHYYNNDWSQQGNPQRPEHYWNYMNSKWKDGRHVTYDTTGIPTNYMFPGKDDPNGKPEWSEESAHWTAGDRRFLMATGSVPFMPGTSKSVDYAMVYTRTASSAMPVLPKLESDVKRVKNWFQTNSFPVCTSINGLKSLKRDAGSKLTVYPNPTTGVIRLSLASFDPKAQFEIFDVTGRLISHGPVPASYELSVTELTSGVYFIRLSDAGTVQTARFIKE